MTPPAGLDTCVVLRLLVGEPNKQATLALHYLEQAYGENQTVFVSDLVVAETFHGLCHHYHVPTAQARQTIREFLSSPMITPTGHALTVLNNYTKQGAGFMDQLIRQDLLEQAKTVVTFDKKFSRLPDVTCLASH